MRLTLVPLLSILSAVYGYDILLMCPFPAPSHWLWVEHFARGLVDRGHHLTVIGNHPTKHPHPNYTEILIDPPFDIPQHFPKDAIFEMKFSSYVHNLFMWWKVGLMTSEHALQDVKIQELIKSKGKHFDLVIMEQFFHESFLMFAHKFNAPIITVGTFGYADYMDRAMGSVTPYSIVPHIVVPYSDNMSFYERAYNTFLSNFDHFMRTWYYIPAQQELAEKYFKPIEAEVGPLKQVADLEKSISMMFINSHISTDPPRPKMPNLIDVGGIHIKKAKPLPEDIQNFLDNATHGAIYFSLGSYIQGTDMPKEKLNIILETFARLPQRVIWKYEDERISNITQNIMVQKWMPQSDILRHPKISLFITHGGVFGTQEGIYNGVPMLFLPLFGDQHRNSLRCTNAGFGLEIPFADITVDSLLSKIRTILNNNKFALAAKEKSRIFQDNPIHPMDESMFWIEYVVRHKGAVHMKSAGIHLSLYQYLLIDVFLLFFSVIFISMYISFKILSFMCKGSKQTVKNEKCD